MAGWPWCWLPFLHPHRASLGQRLWRSYRQWKGREHRAISLLVRQSVMYVSGPTCLRVSSPIPPRLVARKPGDTAKTSTSSFLRKRCHCLIIIFRPVFVLRYASVKLRSRGLGHPAAGEALIKAYCASIRSVPTSGDVPLVVDSNRGEADFSRSGMNIEVVT